MSRLALTLPPPPIERQDRIVEARRRKRARERSREYRRRVKCGELRGRVTINYAVIDWLIREQFLEERNLGSPAEIFAAAETALRVRATYE